MPHRNPAGLGLGIPRSELSHSGRENARRSHSLNDPVDIYSRNPNRSAGISSCPHSACSVEQDLSSGTSNRAMTELNAAAEPEDINLTGHTNHPRTCSDHTNPGKFSRDISVANSQPAHLRARSAPTTDVEEDLANPQINSRFPRADSLLRLDSNTTSKDLKKLLTTRVRHTPSSIDTNKANAAGISSSSPVKNSPKSSQFEPEKSRPRVEVYVTLNNYTAVEGGYFSGVLILRIRKPRRGEARHVRVDGGKIRVIGFEGISELERYAFYQCLIPLPEASEDSSQLYQSEPDKDGFRIAQEGTFSLSFTIPIPHSDLSRPNRNAPKGVIRDNSVNAEVKYILLASFRVRDDADNSAGIDKHANLNSVSIAHFYRNVELWPTYGPTALYSAEETHPMLGKTGTVSARTAQSLLFGGSGMLHLTAALHRRLWLAGQKCTVYIGAWNETRKTIKTMILSIIRTATICRPNHHGTSNKKHIAEATLDAARGPNFGSVTGKGWWSGIEPGASCEFSHSIDVPADALTVIRTHIIEVSYILRVTLVTGSLSSNVSVDLPLCIINALSTDGLPVPPPPGLLVRGLKLPKELPVCFTFDTMRKYPPTILDSRSSSSADGGPFKSGGVQRKDVLEWTKRTLDGLATSDDGSSELCDEADDPNNGDYIPRMPRDSNTSHRLSGDLTPADSMSRLMSELEYDLSAPEPGSSRYSSQRSSTINLSALKAQLATRQRVTFLTPKMSDIRSKEPDNGMAQYIQPVAGGARFSGRPKETSSRRSTLENSSVIDTRASDHGHRMADEWNDDDADEVLRSIPMETGGFYSTEGQPLVPSSGISGPATGSSTSSEPWSASGSSYSQPSVSYKSSSFETSPEEHENSLHSRSCFMRSSLKLQPGLGSNLQDDTPRAGSVATFRPEIVHGGVHGVSSRAAMFPTIGSPMFAKSQSAHIVGSSANRYRRPSPPLVGLPQTCDNSSRGNAHPGEIHASDSQSTVRAPALKRNTATASGSTRYSIVLPPPTSALAVVPDTKSRPRSHTGPEPRNDLFSNMDGSAPDARAKSTVRSRIAVLEERSRSRPVSQHSSTSSVRSTIIHK